VPLNYKRSTFKVNFKNVVGCLDVFFNNVGGEIWCEQGRGESGDSVVRFVQFFGVYNMGLLTMSLQAPF